MKTWLPPGRTAVSRSCHTVWQTRVCAGLFNQDNTNTANTSYVGNEWCNFLLLLLFHTFKPFDQAAPQKKMRETHHSLEGWGNTAVLSRKEQSQSLSQYVDHWRVYILSLRIDARNLMSLMAHQQSNQQRKAISEWKLSHSERLTLDIWFATYEAPWKHPCKWRNSVHPSEYINDTYIIPEVVGFQKVSLDSHPPRLPGMLHPNLHIRKENF